MMEREAANEGGLFRWPRGGGISAASSRRLPVVAGLGPGFEPEPRERVSVAEVTWKDAAAGGAGLAARCRRWIGAPAASGPVDARWVPVTFPAPAGRVGGLDVWCACFLSADLIPTPSSQLGLGSMGARKDGHPKSPVPTILS